jgi:D(-)-tartrate dehydratase
VLGAGMHPVAVIDLGPGKRFTAGLPDRRRGIRVLLGKAAIKLSADPVGKPVRGIVSVGGSWRYPAPIAAGEALFSAAEANLLDLHGGLRRDRDILLFDPVHCYGLPGYLQIVELLEQRGWPRSSFWPHGGHLFCLHVAAALRLGGAEVNPLCFQPFGDYGDDTMISEGVAIPPQIPGIGFEGKQDLRDLLANLDV